MATLEELAARVAALEGRAGTDDTARGSMDEDLRLLSDRVDAMRHLVQAVSITQSEQTDRLRRIEERLDAHDGRFTRLDEGQQLIIELLNDLIRRDDEQRTDPDGVSD